MTSNNFVHNFNISIVRRRHCIPPLIVCYYRTPVSTCCTPSYRPSPRPTANWGARQTAHGARSAHWGARAAHGACPFAGRTQRSPVRWHGCCCIHNPKIIARDGEMYVYTSPSKKTPTRLHRSHRGRCRRQKRENLLIHTFVVLEGDDRITSGLRCRHRRNTPCCRIMATTTLLL